MAPALQAVTPHSSTLATALPAKTPHSSPALPAKTPHSSPDEEMPASPLIFGGNDKGDNDDDDDGVWVDEEDFFDNLDTSRLNADTIAVLQDKPWRSEVVPESVQLDAYMSLLAPESMKVALRWANRNHSSEACVDPRRYNFVLHRLCRSPSCGVKKAEAQASAQAHVNSGRFVLPLARPFVPPSVPTNRTEQEIQDLYWLERTFEVFIVVICGVRLAAMLLFAQFHGRQAVLTDPYPRGAPGFERNDEQATAGEAGEGGEAGSVSSGAGRRERQRSKSLTGGAHD
ncbi:hypothetical protein BDZ90DRAFT_224917 [Jaminaea rosea]|uniref:Uncharacterized protein n=1 Tax=Jaminaea rosea TaxID=1569628 RepID=A0A316UZZ2_9BASI|nr:hypothetical protein BDZ90DRAFT_224917 [Jaminaea rosea]PWN29881.1 hypothetical protein BDZ90DRAFT_224917 [Jaminaea rosea]